MLRLLLLLLVTLSVSITAVKDSIAGSIGTIDFVGTAVGSDASGPLLIPAFGIRAFQNVDDGVLAATAVSGIPGLDPEDVEILFGDLELVDTVFGPGTATLTFGDADAGASFFNIFDQGTLISTGSMLEVEVTIVTDLSAPNVGQGTGSATVQLSGAFVGEATAVLDDFTAITPGQDPGTFNISGTLSVVPIPEPNSALLGAVGALVIARSVRRRKPAV